MRRAAAAYCRRCQCRPRCGEEPRRRACWQCRPLATTLAGERRTMPLAVKFHLHTLCRVWVLREKSPALIYRDFLEGILAQMVDVEWRNFGEPRLRPNGIWFLELYILIGSSHQSIHSKIFTQGSSSSI